MPKRDQPRRRAEKTSPRRARAFAVNGPVLRLLRAARGWSQQEAADRAGVSDRTIRNAELGRPIELKSLALLAELYSTPDALLTPKELLAEPLGERGEESQAELSEALVRRWWKEVWNQGRLETIDELASPDCVLHAEGMELHGPDEVKRRTQGIRAAFSDIHIDVEHTTVHGEWVISRWRVAMTHSGPWMGAPPTHQRIVVNGSTWMRVENGVLVEGWDYWEQQQATDAIRAAQPKKASKPQRHKDTEKPKREKPKGGNG